MSDAVTPKNFALLGVAGFVAPRHLRAIHDTGNRLVAACDPHDSVGVLDSYSLDAKFFTEFERFDRHLEKQRRKSEAERLHYLSICSPNYLHDAHVRLALRLGADAICEKPLVINPWNLDQLAELEAETGSRVHTVLQLRLLPSLVALREEIRRRRDRARVNLTYVTRRGAWYHVSWKGQEAKSGGLPTNIGIHFFDLLQWMFGETHHCEVHVNDPDRWSGFLELDRADVRWFLSTRVEDLPRASVEAGKPAFRSITLDGEEMEFSTGFTDLHTRVYEDVLAGGGYGIEDARPSIELAHRIRTTAPSVPKDGRAHPKVAEALR
ncbi:MAG TPA: Gfo/Idh/MocA family oxidoreductase [Sandaracinaceae bacterium LLY-WYZ-13_1]|nr:Gfo/Idh/MocA family oxidoreductase [Sandaracinaceae bacterium LLY-WYZ-13_1]